MKNETHFSSLISMTQLLLYTQYNCNPQLTFVTSLPSQFTVLRLQVKSPKDSLPQNVIVKQIITEDNSNMDPAEIIKLKTRFLNEIASLKFLTSFPKLNLYIPELIVYDIKNTVLVLNDKGTWPSLMTILNSNNYTEAYTGLLEYAKFFANLHGLTFNKKTEFYEIQKDIGATTPPSDSNSDIRKYLPEYKQFFKLVSEKWEKDYEILSKTFDSIEDVIIGKQVFHSFIHCDSGPQNVLCTSDGPVLLDFEFGGYGFSLLDIVGPRIAFQQSMKGLRIPLDIIQSMEKAYFAELQAIVKEKINIHEFNSLICYAQAHWVFGRFGYFIKNILNNHLIKIASNERNSLESTEKEHDVASKMLTLLIEFNNNTSSNKEMKILMKLSKKGRGIIETLWPSIKPLSMFDSLVKEKSYQESLLV